MPRKFDVTQTADKIDEMVEVAKYLVGDLERAAASMREKNNLEYASDAVLAVVNAIQNLRLDLMVTRPLRETMK